MQMLRMRDQDNLPVSVANILVTVEEEASVGCPPTPFLSCCPYHADPFGNFLEGGGGLRLPSPLLQAAMLLRGCAYTSCILSSGMPRMYR